MDYQKAKDSLLKQLGILEKLNDAGLIEMVGHINTYTIFFNDDIDVNSTRRIINKLFVADSDRLESYYMSHCGNCLVTIYSNGIINSHYQSSDIEPLLQKISKGKCKVVESVEPQTTVKTIICEMEEEA